MSSRDSVLAKPGAVRVVVHAWMTKDSLEDPGADYETLAFRALAAWERIVSEGKEIEAGYTEIELAECIVAGLRKQDVWGKILRGNAS
jgi:hypothetical protein